MRFQYTYFHANFPRSAVAAHVRPEARNGRSFSVLNYTDASGASKSVCFDISAYQDKPIVTAPPSNKALQLTG